MNSFFFCGIGGIGMSALARFLKSHGANITGSDQYHSDLLNELQSEGIEIFSPQSSNNLPENIQEFIYSEAIPENNPERQEAKKRGVPQRTYFEKIGEISENYFTICIAGTHGKSTTTAMTGLALETANVKPNVIVGTKIFEWENENFKKGSSNILVVESCEYRESFLHLHPNIILLTSLEPEHLDYYKTAERYFHGFEKFIAKLPKDGILIADFSDKNIQQILRKHDGKKIDAHNFLSNVPELQIPGDHNRQNASKVLALFSALDLDLEIAKKSLAQYRGAWRRFEQKGEKNGVLVMDDYGHHPTELKVTLSALKEKFPDRKKWIVFEPHQYSRTFAFLKEFGKSFPDADEILIPGIYRVRDSEEDMKKISPEILVAEIQKNLNSKQRVRYSESYEKTIQILNAETKSGDVVLTIGAGSVNEVGERFLNVK